MLLVVVVVVVVVVVPVVVTLSTRSRLNEGSRSAVATTPVMKLNRYSARTCGRRTDIKVTFSEAVLLVSVRVVLAASEPTVTVWLLLVSVSALGTRDVASTVTLSFPRKGPPRLISSSVYANDAPRS